MSKSGKKSGKETIRTRQSTTLQKARLQRWERSADIETLKGLKQGRNSRAPVVSRDLE